MGGRLDWLDVVVGSERIASSPINERRMEVLQIVIINASLSVLMRPMPLANLTSSMKGTAALDPGSHISNKERDLTS